MSAIEVEEGLITNQFWVRAGARISGVNGQGFRYCDLGQVEREIHIMHCLHEALTNH